MNVLAIGAHFDDIELGCAGSLISHVQNKDKVTIMVVTDSSYASPSDQTIRDKSTAKQEGEKAAAIIGADLITLDLETFYVRFNEDLTGKILSQVEGLKIDTIYAPWINDVHRDHSNTARAAMMAGRHVPRFLMYQANWYESSIPFNKQIFKDISTAFDKKVEALKAHESEIRRTEGKWIDFITHTNGLDGLKVGVDYAESFEAIRYLL